MHRSYQLLAIKGELHRRISFKFKPFYKICKGLCILNILVLKAGAQVFKVSKTGITA
jgi:hypothetical protein